jgi:hypothetical protein
VLQAWEFKLIEVAEGDFELHFRKCPPGFYVLKMPPNCGPGDTIKVDTSVNLQFTVEDGMVPGGTSLAHVYVDQYAVRGAEESFSCARTLQKPDSKHSAHAGFDGPSHTVLAPSTL